MSDEVVAGGASRHGGDRSFQRDVDWETAKHVVRYGVPTPQENGNIKHVGRHPKNPDHLVTVITTPHPKRIVTVFKEHSPIAKIESEQRKQQGEEKAKADLSRKRQAEQLAKKRARTPKPKNK
jgi:hypothetical protein